MYEVAVEYMGDFSKDKNDVKEGVFGPFQSRAEAEQVAVNLAAQQAQHFWAIVKVEIKEIF